MEDVSRRAFEKEYDVIGRINELREQKGISVYRLSKLSGIPVNTLTAYSNADRQNTRPSMSTIEAIANKGFGLTLAEFFGNAPSALTNAELELLSYWRTLSEDEQSTMLAVMKQLAAKKSDQ